MKKNILVSFAGAGFIYAGSRLYRKYITATDIVPKFQLPRNWKYSKLSVSFDLPFTILNTHSESISLTGFGGKITYKGEDFTDFFLSDGISIEPTSKNTYTAKCSLYLPDALSVLKKLSKDINKALNFEVKGNYYVLGLPIPYDETVKITFPSQIISAIKTILKIR